MDTKIIFLYCLADAISKALKMREDPQSKMTQAEIITFVMISALFYQGNYQMTHQVTQSCRYFSKLLSHSRLIRRIHQIDESVWLKIFAICRDLIKTEQCTDYIVDSYPVAVCENYKRFRCKLFPGKKFHGYTASKKQYFFGIKVHMLVNSEGVPMNSCFLQEENLIFEGPTFLTNTWESPSHLSGHLGLQVFLEKVYEPFLRNFVANLTKQTAPSFCRVCEKCGLTHFLFVP